MRQLPATSTLTATSSPDSSFTGEGGACSGTGACVVTLNAVQAVTANFGKDPSEVPEADTLLLLGGGLGGLATWARWQWGKRRAR